MTSMKLLKICFPTIITDNCSNNSNKQPAGLHCENSNTKITQMLNNIINSKTTKINKSNGFTPGVHNLLDLHHLFLSVFVKNSVEVCRPTRTENKILSVSRPLIACLRQKPCHILDSFLERREKLTFA